MGEKLIRMKGAAPHIEEDENVQHNHPHQQLVMIITKEGKYVGKHDLPVNVEGSEHEDTIILHDAISIIDGITNQGPVSFGTILGELTLMMGDLDNVVIVDLINKSPYYSIYYQAVSNLTIPGGKQ